MKIIVCIETSTEVCSVCIAADGKILSSRFNNENKSHAALLTVFIDELLKETNILPQQINAVAVSMGPGSYTGLRIGVSAAKGLAFGTGAALIGISTLESMTYGARKTFNNKFDNNKDLLFVPLLDARRMEVYSAVFNNKGEKIRDVSAEIIDETSFYNELNNNNIFFFGNGAEKCKDLISGKDRIFITDFVMQAENLVELAFQRLENKMFEDLAYFEPYYLKDFIAKKSKDLLKHVTQIKK
ncbi:MAG: tRNA (adenosine(37)-N6)-threonylcarbamoyltransferase complex dimerization subunit type 1 TsaB [Bacteroidales bacterium]|nr:tRNA (adenosine(37)-N6)-threonylcarbamoyltransferase complex dimerization subunit type 1 TsaB [Bacteroidales bacterium]